MLGTLVLTGGAAATQPKEPSDFLDFKEHVEPELIISSSHEPLEEVLDRLPNQAAWQAFLAARGAAGVPAPTHSVDVSSFAGETVRILVEAADASGGSLVEAGVDDVEITQQ